MALSPRAAFAPFLALMLAATASAQGPVHTPRVHAFTGARIVQGPGRVIEKGTLVIRDGVIEAVGAAVAVPADARVWKADSLTIYPGLIDLAVTVVPPGADKKGGGGAKPEPTGTVRARFRATERLPLSEEDRAARRAEGFTTIRALPSEGAFRGEAALVSLGAGGIDRSLILPEAGQVLSFATSGDENIYPSSIMGVISLIRQSVADARRQARARAIYAGGALKEDRPAIDLDLAALEPLVAGRARAIFVTDDLLNLMRAGRLARELGLAADFVGSGDEYERLDELKQVVPALIVPVDFPAAPDVDTTGSALNVTTERLRAWDLAPGNPARLREGGVTFALTADRLKDVGRFRKNVGRAIGRGLPEDAALAALTTVPALMAGVEKRLGTLDAGKIASFVMATGPLFADTTKVRAVWIDGDRYEVEARAAGGAGKPDKRGGKPEPADAAAVTGPPLVGDAEAWHVRRPEMPAVVLVKNATVWTCGPQGKLEGADVLVRQGKIVQVGSDLTAPAGAVVVDATGKHVTPGLIDSHSHIAISGDVNEGTENVSAETRIEDVVNSETIHIYRQLAGGVTCANLLHGSANAIGGQSCAIKLRYGEGPEGLKLAGAEPGIKFALGENPKQSDWGDREHLRYPQTRSGVEEVIRERFLAARDYMAERNAWKRGDGKGIPPRIDYQLEALAEVLRGERAIHCHAYRADEILMMMRLAEEFGVRVGSFGHVLEGYKVANEMAAHGAGASVNSDWWGYKFEVYDGIPYNGAILWDRGVVASFSSDDPGLARLLNYEAAKAVKYGGVPEVEALKFVTLNAAKQMGIDGRVGSLEPGKDADFAIWSGSPLSTFTQCEQTWVDGRCYFDRVEELAARPVRDAEREALLAKARAAARKESR